MKEKCCLYCGAPRIGPSKTGVLIEYCDECLDAVGDDRISARLLTRPRVKCKCEVLLCARESVDTGLCFMCREEARRVAPLADRKGTPVCTGVLDYFPDALRAVSRLSKAGNDKHNPGQPLHWDKSKSTDHADCIARHLLERGTIDPETGLSHTVAVAWRALALLQTELEGKK